MQRVSAARLAPLVLIAMLATAPVITGRSSDARQVSDQDGVARASSKPVVLAQGRCFNGRCF